MRCGGVKGGSARCEGVMVSRVVVSNVVVSGLVMSSVVILVKVV